MERLGQEKKKKNPPQQAEGQKCGEYPRSKLTKQKTSKQHPDAVLIKRWDGKSYSNLLGEIRQNARPEEGAVVKVLRKPELVAFLLSSGSLQLPLTSVLICVTSWKQTPQSAFWSQSPCLRWETWTSSQPRRKWMLLSRQHSWCAHWVWDLRLEGNDQGQKMAILSLKA